MSDVKEMTVKVDDENVLIVMPKELLEFAFVNGPMGFCEHRDSYESKPTTGIKDKSKFFEVFASRLLSEGETGENGPWFYDYLDDVFEQMYAGAEPSIKYCDQCVPEGK